MLSFVCMCVFDFIFQVKQHRKYKPEINESNYLKGLGDWDRNWDFPEYNFLQLGSVTTIFIIIFYSQPFFVPSFFFIFFFSSFFFLSLFLFLPSLAWIKHFMWFNLLSTISMSIIFLLRNVSVVSIYIYN